MDLFLPLSYIKKDLNLPFSSLSRSAICKMELPIFLLFFIILPTIGASSSNEISPNDLNITLHSMIMQTCIDVEDQTSCLTNLATQIGKMRSTHPNAVLTAALRITLDEAKRAIETISRFTTLSFSFREQMAIGDCKELLDFSVSELALSLVEIKSIRAGKKTIHEEGNLKAWLSAALSNQDTCLEGFEGTNMQVEKFIRGSLKIVTQLIANVLALYTQLHSFPYRPTTNHTHLPYWDYPKWPISDSDHGKLLETNPGSMHVDVVVSSDGSGNYSTITEAIAMAPNYSKRRFIIYVKRGVYRENIDMKRKKTNIMLVGDGIGETIVTGDRNFMQGWTTFRTATVAVSGKGFIARGMTFRNTAGPENFQGVALRVDSDQSAFFRCSIEGHQDSLYIHSLRQFYRECSISGTIDYIFGNGAAVLQNCKIFTGVPLPLQKVTITAQGRKNPHQSTGFSIQNSFIYASQPTYLGRPWKQYSRTVFLNTYMSELVQPRGWLEWWGDFALGTLWYGEYKNYGPGADLSGRVKWPGFHVIRDPAAASFFTVGRFIDGRSWLPATGVRFNSGLSA